MTPLWQLFTSGAVGSSLTYAFTWWRERRRTLDAYNAPQRAAIGDIVSAIGAVMLSELDSRKYLTDMVESHRNDEIGDPNFDETKTPVVELAKSTLDAERAFQIGSLNIVDAPTFEAFGIAYVELTRLRNAMNDPGAMSTPEDIEQYVATTKLNAINLSKAATGLVNTASQRLTPAETFWNRRKRHSVRRRLAERHSLPAATDGEPT